MITRTIEGAAECLGTETDLPSHAILALLRIVTTQGSLYLQEQGVHLHHVGGMYFIKREAEDEYEESEARFD